MPVFEPCPLWGGGKVVEYAGDGIRVDNIRAGGKYEITGTAGAVFDNKRTDALAAKLTTWIIDQHRSGIVRPVINSDILRLIEVRPRLKIAEQMDRFFVMLSFLDARANFMIQISGTVNDRYNHDRALLASWLECENDDEVSGVIGLLMQSNLITTPGLGGFFVGLTPNGVQRLTEAQRGGVTSRQAFIAMWFDPSMNDAATQGIELAITAAGYSPMRIDKKEHANKIDDEIIAEIKKSKFVVADFTSELTGEGDKKTAIARGGVYFEAGFALGLGLPVIWCCREDVLKYVHFDTRQFSHVVWTTPKDLAENLYNRICVVIGETPDAPGKMIL